MKIKTLTLLMMVLLFQSCHHSPKEPVLSDIFRPHREKALPMEVPLTDVLAPDTLKVSAPIHVRAQNPNTYPARPFEKRDLSHFRVEAQSPRLIMPGHQNTEIPQIIQVKDTFVLAGIPLMTNAKEAYSPLHNAQSFSFYTRQQGLQHDDISSLAIDQSGNMWIGTYGAGAIRFDGINFYQYSLTEGLSHNYILSLLTSQSGDIWLGTRAEGAMRFDGRKLYFYNTQNGLPDNRVETLFEDSQGRVWLGTYKGVARYDGETMTRYTHEHIGGDIVYVILEDQGGNIWFGSRGGGITKYDGNNFHQYTARQGLICDYIVTGESDSSGHLWFGSFDNGICKFDGTHFYHYTTRQGLLNNHIRSIREDSKGNIWLGSTMGGLSRISNGSIYFFKEDQGLINPYVTSIKQDRNGTLWLGTYGSGLAKYQGNIFTHFFEMHGLKDGFVRSIMQDKEGYIWLGTNTGGVFRYDGNEFVNYTTDHGLSHNRIGGMLQDHHGNIWFATTGGGITVFDGQHFWYYNEENGFIDDFLLHIMQDSQQNIWLVTRNHGIVKYDGTHFYVYGTKQGLSDQNARVVIEDKSGNIWAGTRAGGVVKYDGNSFTHFTQESGLLSNNILDMLEDQQGRIWIATNGSGVSMYDGEYFTHFTEREGLVNNYVYSLLEDHEGNIWMGTRMGLSKLINYQNLSATDATGKNVLAASTFFKNYTPSNGYLGIGTNSRAMFQDDQGLIWIGANDILTLFNPGEEKTDSIPPITQIKHVGLFNEMVPWSNLLNRQDSIIRLPNGVIIKDYHFTDISTVYGLPQNLQLSHNNNYITIGFVGISGSIDDKVKYLYKLSGLEDQWSSLSSRTEVSYGNLSPGIYTFRVKSINSDGYWSDEASFTFRIRPPIWRTPGAYFVYILVGIFMVLMYHQVQMKKFTRKEQERQKELFLQQEIAIARKSAEFKQNFLANMSHEIRTPLTGVIGMANLLKQLPLDEKAREYVNDLNKSGESLRDTINMILDISKIEAGKLSLRKTDFSLHDVFEDHIKLFTPLCKENVTIESYIDETIPVHIHSDQQRISQIIKNFLSNAVKFTSSGKIILTAIIDSDWKSMNGESFFIKISVCDTGPGIDFQEQKKLFTPFYQIEQTKDQPHEGTGLGLSICKELAYLLGGKIGLDSTPGKGSCFWFTFKTRKGETSDILSAQTPKTPRARTGKKLSILFVDDKPLIQKVVSLMLKSMDFHIELASNGAQALEKFKPEKFDLILMDIQMPIMDGITATQKLKKKYSPRELPPIVGLSANAFEGDRKKYMDQGLDEYITKPIKEKDLEELIQKLGLI